VGGEPIVREVVRRFVDARLFTTSRTVDGVAVVEVAHEALISEWPRLRAWLDDDREGLRVRQRLHQQAVEWVDEHRDESLLYRGAQLRLAIEVDERGQFELDGLERSFLDASRDEERRVDTLRLEAERERLRRAERDRLRRRVTIGLVSGLTIAMVLAAIALLQSREARRQRETARSLRLAAQSSVVAPRQLDLGLLLALQAQATSGSSEARGSLADALARTPRPARYLRLPAGTNLSAPLALAPAGTVVAGALSDGTVRLWDPRTGATLTTWPNHEHGAATALAFSGSGRQLALGFQDGTLGLRDVATGIARGGRTRHRESVESVTVVGESTVVSAAQDQPAVDEFGAASVRAHVLGSGTEPVSAVAASPDGQRLATSSDQAVRIWSLRTDAPLGAPLLDASSDFPPSRGTTLAWTPDGARLLVDAGRLQEFNGYNGVPTSAPSSLTGLSLVAVGGASVASALGQEVLLLDGRDTSTAPTVLTGHTSTVEGVAIARDGSTVVSSAADGVIVWYVDKLSPLATTLTGHESTVTAVAFIGDGSRLASAAQDGTVRQWDVRHRRELDPLETPQSVMSRLVYVRQARRLIGTTIDGHLVAWDAGSGAIVGRSASTTQNEAISALAVTNDGSIVATADRRGSVVLWNVATLRPTATMNQRAAVRGLAFSPNGKILASAGDDHTVRLWNVPAGTALGRPLAGHTGLVGAVAFSPDGKLLASGSDDRTVRLWDVRRRATNAVLAGHTDFVLNLRFSADGRTLASSGEDGNVILWDVEDHVAVGSPLPPASPSFIVDMDESTSGRLLAAAQGHDIVLWDIDESSWHAQACLTANRSLTEQERSQYLNRRAPVRVCGSG
jgi:WD40 repeat protein